jgi:hypothetical protein
VESLIVVKMEQWRREMSRTFEKIAKDSDDELQEKFLATIHQNSSDSDEEVKQRRRGCSCLVRMFVHMDKKLWHEHLVRDYFAPTHRHVFEDRPTMKVQKTMLLRLLDAVEVQAFVGARLLGLSRSPAISKYANTHLQTWQHRVY